MSKFELQRPAKRERSEQERNARNLLFQSFRFSQGHETLQYSIMQWLVTNGYFDEIDVPREPPSFVEEMAIPKGHSIIEDTDRLYQIRERWDELYTININRQFLSPANISLSSMLLLMIERDLVYQDTERPNRQISGTVKPDSSNDPHASFVREYVIKASSTGIYAFNELHKNLRAELAFFENPLDQNPIFLKGHKKLCTLSEMWENNHTGEIFSPDFATSQQLLYYQKAV